MEREKGVADNCAASGSTLKLEVKILRSRGGDNKSRGTGMRSRVDTRTRGF